MCSDTRGYFLSSRLNNWNGQVEFPHCLTHGETIQKVKQISIIFLGEFPRFLSSLKFEKCIIDNSYQFPIFSAVQKANGYWRKTVDDNKCNYIVIPFIAALSCMWERDVRCVLDVSKSLQKLIIPLFSVLTVRNYQKQFPSTTLYQYIHTFIVGWTMST